MSSEWFSTSRSGLRKQCKERGAARIFLEVAASNPLDERENGMTSITIQVEPIEGQPLANVVIEDNSPTGFKDLSHAYTIFAESSKRGNPELRGQFNFGEKQFLSLCRKAKIATTTGTVDFNDKGRHDYPRRKRPSGTRIEAIMEITRAEVAELEYLLLTLLLPEGVSMDYNGEPPWSSDEWYVRDAEATKDEVLAAEDETRRILSHNREALLALAQALADTDDDEIEFGNVTSVGEVVVQAPLAI